MSWKQDSSRGRAIPKTLDSRLLMLFATGLLAMGCLKASGKEANASPPNILVIFTDDQGMNDVGCYGSEIPTPHIDSLARDGLKFTQWYVASSICTPSRFGLLTGRNPSRSRDRLLGALMFLDPRDGRRGLHPEETSIARLLSHAGYRCGLIGKWHLGHGDPMFFPHRHGFQHTYGHTAGCVDFYTMSYGNTPDWYRHGQPISQSGYATDLITDEAVTFLHQQPVSQPFFLLLAYNAPHFGKGWDDGNDQPVNLLQPHPSDLAALMHIKDPTRRKFAAMVASLDRGIGRVLGTLTSQGLDQSTLVIFMTDHGGDPNFGGDNQPFRAGKATLFEGGIRVPCIMRWPGKIPSSKTSNAVASALDLFPTLATLAGVSIDDHELDGIDISRHLLEDEPLPRRSLFWEIGVHEELEREPWLALREGDWKYVQTPKNGEWLFHLQQDPYERQNLQRIQPRRFTNLQRKARALAVRYGKASR